MDNSRFILEFYRKVSSSKYELNQQVDLEQQWPHLGILDVLQVTYEDLDNSGSIDLVLLLQLQGGNIQMHILYGPSNNAICQPFSSFPFDFLKLKETKLSGQLTKSSILTFGDVNYDGLPDLLATINKSGQLKAVLMLADGNGFNDDYQFNNPLRSIKNAAQAFFFDLGEDGTLDIVCTAPDNSSQNTLVRHTIVNNLKYDAFFLKLLPLSASASYEGHSNRIANALGVSVQWHVTTLDGGQLVQLCAQKTQQNYGIIQLPYCLKGLSRTNNYVQDLTVGYQGYGQEQQWSPIIPNSQLMVYRKYEGAWKLQVLLASQERENIVIYVSIFFLVLLGLLVLLLYYWESQEDKRDHYNFIQLIR